MSNNCPADGNVAKTHAVDCTPAVDATLPPVSAATSDASTVLMESANDATWSCTESDVDANTAEGDNLGRGPGIKVKEVVGSATPTLEALPGQERTLSWSQIPDASPASALFNSGQNSRFDEISSHGIVAKTPPAIEMIERCNPVEEFALINAHASGAEIANKDDDGTADVGQPVDADLPVSEVEPLNPFEEEPLNPFDEEPFNQFEEEPLNPFVDGAEPPIKDDVLADEEEDHLQTKGVCGSPLNPFDSPMTYCAITTGIALPSAESSPETIADMPEITDPLDISIIPRPNGTPTTNLPKLGSSSSNSLTPLRRRVSEAISLEDTFVFPSLQDTMASLKKSATPSKAQSMNLSLPPHNMESTKKPDNSDTSGMCSAPATVADIPLLLTESGSPSESQAKLPRPLKDSSVCASNSSSWEGFDIIDAAQMELASIIKETRCHKTFFTSSVYTFNACCRS